MNGFLLDTNVPSETLRNAPDKNVVDWLKTSGRQAQFVSVVTIGELRKGAIPLARGAKRTELEHFIEVTVPEWFGPRILPVTQAIAEKWGALDVKRKTMGRPLSVTDGFIAATALEHDLFLVTRNVRDFEELGLVIINPWA